MTQIGYFYSGVKSVGGYDTWITKIENYLKKCQYRKRYGL